MTTTEKILATGLALGLCTILAGCGNNASEPAGGGMAAAQVSAVELQPRDLPARFEYVGRLEASREIEIRPRVTGLIEQRLFEEGGRIKAGDTLFRIDAAPFAAHKRAAAAALAEARARVAQTEREVRRLTPLASAQAISQRELDDAVSDNEQARAAVAVAEAELAQAQLELDYTEVKAPLSGRIGRALQVEGALVSPTSGPLAYLAQIDPLYVRFSIPENDRLAIDRQLAEGSLVMPPADQARVTVRLGDGTPYAHPGVFDYSDYRSDSQTGAFESRATLPNPDAQLNPGQFVRVQVQGGIMPGALAVPQRAVQEDAQGKFVYVIGQGEQGMTIALAKHIEVGRWVDLPADTGSERLWVIRDGLAAGDRVIVDGTARIFFPGMPVQAQEPGAAPDTQAGGGEDH